MPSGLAWLAPICAAPAAVPSAPRVVAVRGPQGATVLLVEDDASVRAVAARMLSRGGLAKPFLHADFMALVADLVRSSTSAVVVARPAKA